MYSIVEKRKGIVESWAIVDVGEKRYETVSAALEDLVLIMHDKSVKELQKVESFSILKENEDLFILFEGGELAVSSLEERAIYSSKEYGESVGMWWQHFIAIDIGNIREYLIKKEKADLA